MTQQRIDPIDIDFLAERARVQLRMALADRDAERARAERAETQIRAVEAGGETCPRCRPKQQCECGHLRGVHGWTCSGSPGDTGRCPCRGFRRAFHARDATPEARRP